VHYVIFFFCFFVCFAFFWVVLGPANAAVVLRRTNGQSQGARGARRSCDDCLRLETPSIVIKGHVGKKELSLQFARSFWPVWRSNGTAG